MIERTQFQIDRDAAANHMPDSATKQAMLRAGELQDAFYPAVKSQISNDNIIDAMTTLECICLYLGRGPSQMTSRNIKIAESMGWNTPTLSEIKKRVEELDAEATKGPWKIDPDGEHGFGNAESDHWNEQWVDLFATTESGSFGFHDADFIAYARTALPQLLRLAEQLQAERDKCVEAINEALSCVEDMDVTGWTVETIRNMERPLRVALASLNSNQAKE